MSIYHDFQGCPYCRFKLLAGVPHAFIIHDTRSLFEFETANKLQFEPGTPGLQAATLAIKLHFFDQNYPLIIEPDI